MQKKQSAEIIPKGSLKDPAQRGITPEEVEQLKQKL